MSLKSAIAVSLVLLTATPALAVPLPNFTLTPLPGTSVAERPELAGTVLVDRLVPYSFGGGGSTLSGSIQQRVVRSTLDGTLDFYWRVIGDGTGDLGVTALRIGNFGPYIADGDWASDGIGTEAPLNALTFDGTEVNFRFDGDPVAGGDSSRFFFLKTTATHYADTAIYDLTSTGGITGLYSTFAPSAVPEPAQWALLVGGLGVVGVVARRRRHSAAVVSA